MTIEQLSTQLLAVKEEIKNWQTKDGDFTAEERFSALERQLKTTLEKISSLSSDDRKKIDPLIETFRKEMEEHYAVTKEKLDEIRRQFELSQTRANAVKAYNKQTV